MVHEPGSDPVEIGVLAALMSGTATLDDVVLHTGQPASVVQPVLDRAVAEQTVSRIDLARAPAYSLTPTGMYLVTRHQGAPVADTGPVDLGTATPIHSGQGDPTHHLATGRPVEDAPAPSPTGPGPEAAGPVAAGPAVPPEPRGVDAHQTVTKRHVAYAVGYILVGLFLMLLQPIIGLVAVLAGVALGAVALRPLWRSGPPATTDAGRDA